MTTEVKSNFLRNTSRLREDATFLSPDLEFLGHEAISRQVRGQKQISAKTRFYCSLKYKRYSEKWWQPSKNSCSKEPILTRSFIFLWLSKYTGWITPFQAFVLFHSALPAHTKVSRFWSVTYSTLLQSLLLFDIWKKYIERLDAFQD